MTMQMFEDALKDRIEALSTGTALESAQVVFVERARTEEATDHGIALRVAGDQASPVYYFDNDYRNYESGYADLTTIAENILKMNDREVLKEVMEKKLGTFKEEKDNITIRLIGYESNREMLKEMPHIRIADLACTYQIRTEMENSHVMTAMNISNDVMKLLGTDVGTLHQAALSNMSGHQDIVIKPISEMLGVESYGPPIYVVSNESGYYGAAAILCPEAKERLQELLGDFYVLPSSKHEVLAVPKEIGEIDYLKHMVSSINQAEVAPKDILSNEVYTLKEAGLLEIAGKEAQHELSGYGQEKESVLRKLEGKKEIMEQGHRNVPHARSAAR